MISSFSTHHYLAEKMAWGRTLLAGDAAHVLSPIGGQGMNLGWLDAWDAVHVIQNALTVPQPREQRFSTYASTRRRAAIRAIKRSEFNMWMGRSAGSGTINYLCAAAILKTPLKKYFARRFTMRGL
jgi:2-polyprenyl-6-methoxyphenol hydroxylase-like FAD-dependent oxidoreductase